MVFAKAMHMNGVGCRIMAVSKLWNKMGFRGSEEWEFVRDNQMLILTPAIADRGCPLKPWDMDVMEEFLLDRLDRGLGVMFASRHPITDYEDKWWGDEFLAGVKDVTIKLEMGDAQ